MPADSEIIREQTEKILASGVLGRSRFYAALLEYLARCGERGHAPKEIEIAAEVFNRGSDFDPSQDSMVRVYAHNLRQKLQQYYADQGRDEPAQVTLPKGEYRLALTSPGPELAPPALDEAPLVPASWGGRLRLALVIAVSLAAGAFIDRLLQPAPNAVLGAQAEVAASPLWRAVTNDDRPVVLVVGDYYIFGERDRYGNVERMLREFEVNSSRDLDDLLMLNPDAADRYVDLDLTYVPSSIPVAVQDLSKVLLAAGKSIRVVSASDLAAGDLRDNHIVYVGYVSGLGMLADFAFAGSRLRVGETYDELVDAASGTAYVSEAGLPSRGRSYRDYGLFSTLPGPSGNQYVFVTGMRDEGLMETARAVSNPLLMRSSIRAVTGEDGRAPAAFEVLYEVAGMDRTNLDATIVHAGPLDESRVAIGHLIPGG